MNIFTADNNKTLIDKLVEEVIAKAAKDITQNYIVIVPEKFSVTIEKQLLVKSSRKALFNVQVITLSRLLHKLVRSEDNYIPKETGVMIVKKILHENIDNLVCYKKTARTMGFAENIYDTISELKNSNVKPSEYSLKKNDFTTSLNLKLKDVFNVYGEYERVITNNKLVDACDRFNLLAGLILKSDYITNSEVYVLGFDSVTPAGLSVFEAIARSAKQINFSCVDNSGKNNSYICPAEMKDSYINIGKKLKKQFNIVHVNSISNKFAKHISNNLYAYPYSKMMVKNEVVVYEAANMREEAQMVAESIRRRVMFDNLKYSDIAIACSDMDAYKNIIKSVFADYELPMFFDAPEKLIEHPFIGFILSVLNTIRKNFSVDEYMMVASSDFSGLLVEEIGVLENFIIKYGINFDKLRTPFKFNLRTDDEKAFLEKAECAREKLSCKLNKLDEKIKKANSVSDYIDAICYMFELFDAANMLEEFKEKLTKNKDFVMVDVTSQVMKKVQELFNGVKQVFGSSKMDFDELFQMLQAGFSSMTVSVIPISVDNVFVGDVSTSKFFNKKDLYIIGASEGSVPKVKDDCGIIVDKELNILAGGLGKKIEPTIRTINQREKFKIINVCSEFDERLIVSYPRVNAQNEEQSPSSIIRELSKLFYLEGSLKPLEKINEVDIQRSRGLISEEDRIKSFAAEFATEEVATKKLISMIRTIKNGGEVNAAILSSLFAALGAHKKIELSAFYDELMKVQEPRNLKKPKEVFFKSGKTGVTQLETYFSCPFKHFARYGLKLRPREDAELKSLDYGNILHKIAELYMKNIKRFENKGNKDVFEKQKDIEKLINQVFDEEKLKTATNKHMVLLLFGEAKRLINALTYQYRESLFKPVAEEISFGEGGKIPGIKITNGVRIEGKIDRIDEFNKYFRVVDYKTGHIDLSPRTVYYGTKLQLFSYLNACKAFKNLEPAGAFYLPIKNVFVDEKVGSEYSTYKMQGYFNNKAEVVGGIDPKLSPINNKSELANISVSSSKEAKENNTLCATGGNALSIGEINGAADYQKRIIKTAVDEILSGFIVPSPIEEDGRVPCDSCEFKYACGRDFNTTKEVRKTTGGVKFENFVKGEK